MRTGGWWKPLAGSLCLALISLAASAAQASSLPPEIACQTAIAEAEAKTTIPDRLVRSIARVESGRPGVAPSWPWTVNAESRSYYLDSKDEAVRLVQGLQARGVRSIDVGCMQVNLMYHPDAFASVSDAFDPEKNVAYAIRFLRFLRQDTGSWEGAVGRYHSADPDLGNAYRARVYAAGGPELTYGLSNASGLVLTISEARQGEAFRQALFRQKESIARKETGMGARPQRIVILGRP